MIEAEALQVQRYHLLERVAEASDRIARINGILSFLRNREQDHE